MNKKGAELSMSVIIIAALGLLVLLILAFLVVRGASPIGPATQGCTSKYAGMCQTDCGANGLATDAKTDCDADGKMCCKQLT